MRPIDADKLIENHFSDDHRIAMSYADKLWMRRIINSEPTIEQYGTWIPCTERLPEEKIHPITKDYLEYTVTISVGDRNDIRHYKFGKGHWWHFGNIMDRYVTAWMPLPEPYKGGDQHE